MTHPASVAIVTGASRGIGAGIARRLAAEGVTVACVARTLDDGDSALPGSLRATITAIESVGGRAAPFVADLGDERFDADALAATITDALGPVTHLVNNAAACFYLPYVSAPAKRMDLSYRVNVRSPWLLAQAVLPGMIERGAGSVLNISSATAEFPTGPPFENKGIGGASLYGGSKAWLERATIGAAVELQGTGVSANTLAPEYAVLTEGAEAMMAELSERTDIILEPLATMAEATVALLTGDATVLSGQVAYSLSLLRHLDRPVHDLDAVTLVDGWQPADFPTELLRQPTIAGAPSHWGASPGDRGTG